MVKGTKMSQYQKDYWKSIKYKTAAAKYNSTPEEIKNLLEFAVNCPICGVLMSGDTLSNRKCIDHNHETNEIRGVICSGCNLAIGCTYENIETLKNIIKYLEEHL